MAAAATARRASAAAAAPPAAAPKRRPPGPLHEPRPAKPRKPSATRKALARTAPARKPAARPAAPQRPKTRTSPGTRTRRAPTRRSQRLPHAVGRTATAVRGLPDCGPIVGLTRGRAWIFVLGVLLAGIVALNVLTLSYTAAAGGIDSQITTLQQENSVLTAREARLLSNGRVHAAAATLGMVRKSPDEITYLHSGPAAVRAAAARLAADG